MGHKFNYILKIISSNGIIRLVAKTFFMSTFGGKCHIHIPTSFIENALFSAKIGKTVVGTTF